MQNFEIIFAELSPNSSSKLQRQKDFTYDSEFPESKKPLPILSWLEI